MKLKPIITYLLLFAGLISFTFSQTMTLNDAINTALINNPKIKQYKNRLTQKEYDNMAAFGNFLPVINLEGSYTHLNDPLVINLDPIRSAMIQMQSGTQVELANIYNILNTNTPLSQAQKQALQTQFSGNLDKLLPKFEKTLKNQDYQSLSITGIQPLFLGGKLLAAKKYASSEELVALAELKKMQNEIITEITINYTRILLLEKILVTRKNVITGMNEHRNRANKLYEQGLIASFNILRAEVAVAEAERNLINDENNYDIAMSALKTSLAIPENDKIILTDSLLFNEINFDETVLFTQSKIEQPIFSILEQKKIAAEQNYNIARSVFLPQVVAFGKYETMPQYLSAMEPRWAVGVQFKLNLFNGVKDYAKLQSASYLENEVENIISDTERKISLLITKSVKDFNSKKVRYNKLDATLNLAEENLRINEKRFESGMGTSLELIDARLSLEKIEIERLVTLFDYYKSLTEIYSAIGNPTEILKHWNK